MSNAALNAAVWREVQISRASKYGIAIVDYGLGNLSSVMQACNHVGLRPIITSSSTEIMSSAAVILPGVGAFGRAMDSLEKLDLVEALIKFARLGKQIIGICLGMQLLMTEGFEFGHHRGLGIIEGQARRLPDSSDGDRPLKLPHVGWDRIHASASWSGTLLEGVDNGEYMYFVHSYIVRPRELSTVLSTSQYGHIGFCSSLKRQNVFGCQYHPERSGPAGLRVYQNLMRLLESTD